MPWGRSPGGSWDEGSFQSIDGCDVGPVAKSDVAEVLYHYLNDDGRWDGNEVACKP